MAKRRTVTRWAGLDPEALKKRWGREEVYVYGKIDSTNAAAKDLAKEGAPAGTIVVCREQKAGRGREDRTWHSPSEKGVYLSMIFRPEGRPVTPALSVLAGLGVARRLDTAFENLSPMLKWPNDLMADGKKFGGILGESSWSETGPRFVVVGVGVNVKPMKDDLPRALRARATWVQAHDEEADLPTVADAVVAGLEARLAHPSPSVDGATLDLLDRYDWLQDRRVRVKQKRDDEGTVGVCVGIAPDGALLFRPDRGALRRLSSASVEPEE